MRWRGILRALGRIRLARGPHLARRRAHLLALLARAKLPLRGMERATDLLLFAAAHPDDLRVYRLARRALARIARARRPPLTYPFDLPMVRALLETGGTVRFDRAAMDEEKVQALLPHLAGPAEDLALDDETIGTWEWLDRARGRASDAAWVVSRLDALDVPPRLRDHLYDGLGAQVVWRPPPSASRAGAVGSDPKVFLHDGPFLPKGGRPRRLREILERPIRPHRLAGEAAKKMVALAQASLAVRKREIFPISYADPSDVTRFEPGRGLAIVLFGTRPERRLLLEGLWGFLLLKNGIPYGYGCASVLWRTAEVAWNIFPEFRGGESAWAYAQFLRVLYHSLGARAWRVEGYQIGRENEEAIRSGAFWFYRKMGFAPLSPAARARIRAEERRLAGAARSARGGGRTSAETLRRFAKKDLYLFLGRRPRPLLGRDSLLSFGLRVTSLHARGVPRISERDGRREIARAFSLLVATLPPAARRALAPLARAKAARSERRFVLAMNRMEQFFR